MTIATERAVFAGVSFYLTSCEVKESYRHEVLEFISDHPPEPRLYKKAPREFPVQGFLLGDEAILGRDLLLKVVASPKPQTLFLPMLGFLRAVCVDLSLSESSEGQGLLEIGMLFKEVPEPALTGSILAVANQFNDLVDDFALYTLQNLQLLTVTSYGIRRLTDAVCKIQALLTSVNGLGIFLEPMHSVAELAQKISTLVKTPKRLLESILKTTDTLSGVKLEKTILGGNLSFLEHVVKLNSLAKLSPQIRRDIFTELIDQLPTEWSAKLLRCETELFSVLEQRRQPSPHKLSLLAAAYSQGLAIESVIIEHNQSVFECGEVPS